MKFSDIPRYTRDGNYQTSIPIRNLPGFINKFVKNYGLELNPDFQRGHVWDQPRRTAFVEHILRGGMGSRDIRMNCPGWMRDFHGPFVLVDGLQRLTALRDFMANRLPVFGIRLKDLEDPIPLEYTVNIMVNNLPSRAAVLRWYIEINAGGVVHSDEEIDRVRQLLANEEKPG